MIFRKIHAYWYKEQNINTTQFRLEDIFMGTIKFKSTKLLYTLGICRVKQKSSEHEEAKCNRCFTLVVYYSVTMCELK